MATTTNLSLSQPAYNSSAWDVPLNANETILDNQLAATTSIALTNTNVTLTSPNTSGTGQTQAMRIVLTGSLSANVQVIIPSGISGSWIVYNTTSGSYTVTIASGGGGSSVPAPQGYNILVYSDGTNIHKSDDGLLGSGVVNSFSAGTTGLTPSTATTGAITLAGTLGVANGGTALTTTPTNGQLLIGNGTNYTLATLTAGSNISITNGSGSITIASSVASAQLASAWVDFNGNTGAINRAYNVSSITRFGTGSYTVNFTNALPTANYAATGSGSDAVTFNSSTKTTTAYSFYLKNSNNFSLTDCGNVNVIIFGN